MNTDKIKEILTSQTDIDYPSKALDEIAGYGPWWTRCTSETRSHIIINNESTVELD